MSLQLAAYITEYTLIRSFSLRVPFKLITETNQTKLFYTFQMTTS